MIKTIATIFLANIFVFFAVAQQNGNEIIKRTDTLIYTFDNHKYLSFQEYTKVPSSLSELELSKTDIEVSSSYTRDMKNYLERNREQIYQRPKTLLEKGIIRDQILKLDYNKSQINRLTPNLYFYQNSQKKTYFALGSYIQFNKALRFAPNNRFSADLGGSFIRQFNYISGGYSDMWGITSQINYKITDKIKYKFWLEYMLPSNDNSYFGNPLFPGSSIGSALIFKITDRTNAEFGLRYQYYEFKKTWNLETYGRLTYDF